LKSYGLGKGWVFPLKNEVESFDDLLTEAQKMGMAEGFQNGLISGWGSIALKLNPNKTIDTKIKEQWSNLMLTKLESHQLLITKLETERSAIDSGGFLTIRWPDQVNKEMNIDSLDFLISTVPLPTLTKGRYPTVHQIVTSMNKSNYYKYFLNNRKNGIETFQDDKILKRLTKKTLGNE
jgi:hypothetical protein